VSPARSTTTRTASRAPLNRQRILHAALAEVDARGLEALTMQRLATTLGVGAMSLYNHVKNKDDLLAGLGEVIWQEIAAEAPARQDPAGWLDALSRAIRHAGRRHPKALPVLVAGGVFPPAFLEVIADQLEHAGGPEPDPKLINGIAAVSAYALGWAFSEASGSLGTAPGSAEETERQRIRRVTRALPPDTPDRIVDAAIAICGSDIEAAFLTGLAAVIAGSGYNTQLQRSQPAERSRGDRPSRQRRAK
jgi:TetR/AcrR family tetracycline transcriptional repressor